MGKLYAAFPATTLLPRFRFVAGSRPGTRSRWWCGVMLLQSQPSAFSAGRRLGSRCSDKRCERRGLWRLPPCDPSRIVSDLGGRQPCVLAPLPTGVVFGSTASVGTAEQTRLRYRPKFDPPSSLAEGLLLLYFGGNGIRGRASCCRIASGTCRVWATCTGNRHQGHCADSAHLYILVKSRD